MIYISGHVYLLITKTPCSAISVCETDSDTRPSDLGVGLSLVFLLAKTSDEFNKMVKVRAEMETLLKEIKDQVRKNNDGHDVSKAHNLESTTSSCVTDRNENERANVHLEDQVTSSSMEVVSYEKSSEDGCCMRLDVLEEEFHAELERLRVNYGSDIPSFLSEEHDTEVFARLRLHSLWSEQNVVLRLRHGCL